MPSLLNPVFIKASKFKSGNNCILDKTYVEPLRTGFDACMTDIVFAVDKECDNGKEAIGLA